jgi:hypothetical protein
MNCSRNDVVLLPIPFTDLTSLKVRPAIVIGRRGTDLFLVPVSSVLSNTDFPLQEWRAAGLNVASGVKAQPFDSGRATGREDHRRSRCCGSSGLRPEAVRMVTTLNSVASLSAKSNLWG